MKKILLLCVCMVGSAMSLPNFLKRRTFSTLHDLRYHASVMQEPEKLDNKDYFHPDYSSFYKEIDTGVVKRSLKKVADVFKRKKGVAWSPKVLKTLLKKVIKDRRVFAPSADFIQKCTPEPGAQCVCWGNLHGSYHSFVRSLAKLERMGIIDNNLKIVKPKHYLVFTGNVVNLSPLTMDTLTAVLLLMDKNPSRVFFVKGTHETGTRWKKHGFTQEMQHKLKKTKDFVAFETLCSDFFRTLPVSLYLRRKSGFLTRFVQVVGDVNLDSRFKDEKLKDFLYTAENGTFALRGEKKFHVVHPVDIDVYMTGDCHVDTSSSHKGLRMTKKDDGSLVWKMFSAQNNIHKVARNFFYDSFVIFSIEKQFAKSTLSLYYKDSRKTGDFEKKTYVAMRKPNKTVAVKKYDKEIERLNKRITRLKARKDDLSQTV